MNQIANEDGEVYVDAVNKHEELALSQTTDESSSGDSILPEASEKNELTYSSQQSCHLGSR